MSSRFQCAARFEDNTRSAGAMHRDEDGLDIRSDLTFYAHV